MFAFKNILYGVYGWHIIQPESIQGGIELVAIFTISIILVLYMKNKLISTLGILGLSLIYLKAHQVLIPVLTAAIYLEVILFFGRAVIKFLKIGNRKGIKFVFDSLVVGIVSWGILAISLSLLGFGTILALKVLTISVFFISLFSKEYKPFSLSAIMSFSKSNTYQKTGFIFVWLIVLLQFAKSNTALDYDSLWYGLRPEKVLFGAESFYDNLGMTIFVHYYPKLYELLLAPISNLGDYSFIYSVTTFLLLFIYILIYSFFRELKINRLNATIFTCLLASIPAIANMGSTAKTDIFTSLFIVLSAYYLYQWAKYQHIDNLYYALISALISLGGKLTGYLYIPLLFLGVIISLIVYKKFNRKLFKGILDNKGLLLMLFTSVGLWILILYRTLKLTGYPIYPVAPGLWKLLGFDLKYPFNQSVDLMSEKLGFMDLLMRWYKIIFDPRGFTHYVMVWPGNLYLCLVLFTILSVVVFWKKLKHRLFLLITVTPLFVSVLYYISTIPDGGDGNYFIAPIILISVACLYLLNLVDRSSKIFILALCLYIPIQSGLVIVSHPSWSWGTATINYDLTRSDFEAKEKTSQRLEYNGYSGIQKYLEQSGEINNCTGFGTEQLLHELPCRFEDVPHIGSRLGNPTIVQSEKDFLEYLKWGKVKYLVLPEVLPEGYTEVKKVIKKLEDHESTIKLQDRSGYLLDISNVDLESIENTSPKIIYGDGWYQDEGNQMRWMSKQSETILDGGIKGNVTIQGTVPEVFTSLKITIHIDNKKYYEQLHAPGDFKIELKDVNMSGKVNMKIDTSDSFVPKELNMNDDGRELGLFITYISVE